MYTRPTPGWRMLGLFLCICVLCQYALELWHLGADEHFFLPTAHGDVLHLQAPPDGHASQASLTIPDDESCQRLQPTRDVHHSPHPSAEHQETAAAYTKALRLLLSGCPLFLVAAAEIVHVGVTTRYRLTQKLPPLLLPYFSRIPLRAPPALV